MAANSMDGIDYEAMGKAVADNLVEGPTVTIADIDADCPAYLIHFGRKAGPQASPLIYAHRNGDGVTFAPLKAGGWRMCRYWRDPTEVNRYPTKFERDSIVGLVPLMRPNDQEVLSLLPKAVMPTSRQRLVSFREHLLRLDWVQGSDGFTLSFDNGTAFPLRSPEFTDKVWESREAVDWCRRMVPSYAMQRDIAQSNLETAAIIERELEDHPGAFLF